MLRKYFSFTLAGFLLLFLAVSSVQAKPADHPIFTTYEKVEEMIVGAVDDLSSDFEELIARLIGIEADVAENRGLIDGLSVSVVDNTADIDELKNNMNGGIKAVDVIIFPISNLIHDQYSGVHNVASHQMLTLSCLFENGTGGIWVYYSNDQENWELDYRAGCSGNSNEGCRQVISTIKGDYYKFKVVNSFRGEIKAIAY